MYDLFVKIMHAGIVVGAWPCGMIVMIGELFGSESKSQVYGCIHTFLQENKSSSASLCKLYIQIYIYNTIMEGKTTFIGHSHIFPLVYRVHML